MNDQLLVLERGSLRVEITPRPFAIAGGPDDRQRVRWPSAGGR
jgi:hypothetical protein